MSETPLTHCPLCHQPVERLIGAGAGMIFKGSGFYITDYKKKDPLAKAEVNAEPLATTPAADPAAKKEEKPKKEKSKSESDKAEI